eukprot:g10791.t1
MAGGSTSSSYPAQPAGVRPDSPLTPISVLSSFNAGGSGPQQSQVKTQTQQLQQHYAVVEVPRPQDRQRTSRGPLGQASADTAARSYAGTPQEVNAPPALVAPSPQMGPVRAAAGGPKGGTMEDEGRNRSGSSASVSYGAASPVFPGRSPEDMKRPSLELTPVVPPSGLEQANASGAPRHPADDVDVAPGFAVSASSSSSRGGLGLAATGASSASKGSSPATGNTYSRRGVAVKYRNAENKHKYSPPPYMRSTASSRPRSRPQSRSPMMVKSRAQKSKSRSPLHGNNYGTSRSPTAAAADGRTSRRKTFPGRGSSRNVVQEEPLRTSWESRHINGNPGHDSGPSATSTSTWTANNKRSSPHAHLPRVISCRAAIELPEGTVDFVLYADEDMQGKVARFSEDYGLTREARVYLEKQLERRQQEQLMAPVGPEGSGATNGASASSIAGGGARGSAGGPDRDAFDCKMNPSISIGASQSLFVDEEKIPSANTEGEVLVYSPRPRRVSSMRSGPPDRGGAVRVVRSRSSQRGTRHYTLPTKASKSKVSTSVSVSVPEEHHSGQHSRPSIPIAAGEYLAKVKQSHFCAIDFVSSTGSGLRAGAGAKTNAALKNPRRPAAAKSKGKIGVRSNNPRSARRATVHGGGLDRGSPRDRQFIQSSPSTMNIHRRGSLALGDSLTPALMDVRNVIDEMQQTVKEEQQQELSKEQLEPIVSGSCATNSKDTAPVADHLLVGEMEKENATKSTTAPLSAGDPSERLQAGVELQVSDALMDGLVGHQLIVTEDGVEAQSPKRIMLPPLPLPPMLSNGFNFFHPPAMYTMPKPQV